MAVPTCWGTWEDMHVDIWGPRTGKTATRAIPNIVAAPGPTVVTSNKRDVVDATRYSRMRRGRVWVFDPQAQAGEPPSWYWNLLSYVGDSIVRAVKMTSRFSSINRPDHARSDAYFEPAAEDLISNMLLAASLDNLPITRVYTWLTRPTDDTPERILRAFGHDMSADAVENVITAPDRQRAGVYGTAAQIMSFLIAPGIAEWVTGGSDPSRPHFDYLSFVKEGADTIYLPLRGDEQDGRAPGAGADCGVGGGGGERRGSRRRAGVWTCRSCSCWTRRRTSAPGRAFRTSIRTSVRVAS
ncbi:type IV secretory system conjugative DNA transfer family protein [Yinghuangia aomiensis]